MNFTSSSKRHRDLRSSIRELSFRSIRPRVEDFDFLASFPSLVSLNLSDSGVSNLDFVNFLPDLEVLVLSANRLADLSPLLSLTRLRVLNIRGVTSSVYNSFPVNLCTMGENANFASSLRELYLPALPFEHHRCVGLFPSLRKLHFDLLVDFRFFRDSLPASVQESLTELVVMYGNYYSPSGSLSGLEALVNLKSFEFISYSGEIVVSFASLRELSRLERLVIRLRRFNSLDVIQALTNLKILDIQHTSVVDLNNLVYLTNLHTLKLPKSMQIPRPAFLANTLPLLRSLLIDSDREPENIASTEAALQGLVNLEGLVLVESCLTDLTALRDLEKLQNLKIKQYALLVNLAGIENLRELKKLSITEATQLESLDQLLTAAEELEELELSDLPVMHNFDWDAFTGNHRKLRRINVSYVPGLPDIVSFQ
jgi:internalin A